MLDYCGQLSSKRGVLQPWSNTACQQGTPPPLVRAALRRGGASRNARPAASPRARREPAARNPLQDVGPTSDLRGGPTVLTTSYGSGETLARLCHGDARSTDVSFDVRGRRGARRDFEAPRTAGIAIRVPVPGARVAAPRGCGATRVARLRSDARAGGVDRADDVRGRRGARRDFGAPRARLRAPIRRAAIDQHHYTRTRTRP